MSARCASTAASNCSRRADICLGLQLRPFGVAQSAGTKCPLRGVFGLCELGQQYVARSRDFGARGTEPHMRLDQSRLQGEFFRFLFEGQRGRSACAARMRGSARLEFPREPRCRARPPMSHLLRDAAHRRATRCQSPRAERASCRRASRSRDSSAKRRSSGLRSTSSRSEARVGVAGIVSRSPEARSKSGSATSPEKRKPQGRRTSLRIAAAPAAAWRGPAPPLPRGAPNPELRRRARVALLR